MVEESTEGRSLAETSTWAVATVITLLVTISFLSHVSLKKIVKWLDRTNRKSLLAAMEKIKEEIMLFGLLSLLMGHWIIYVAKICVKSSVLSSKFFPCAVQGNSPIHSDLQHRNMTVFKEHVNFKLHDYCPEGHESFASYDSLEQLHRFMFVLGITHVSYSFSAIALAMIKIYSWRVWENEAKTMAIQNIQDPSQVTSNARFRRLSSSFFTRHPIPGVNTKFLFGWNIKIMEMQLWFSRQFWSSINRADYMALRLGFVTTHQLPLTYDFHNYILRSMDDEFRDIVGVSVPLWIYAICCIFLDFHGSHFYFWLSFIPAIMILVIGTKLYRVVVKLAADIMDRCPYMKHTQFNLRDELFWFGKPRLLLWLIQLISFLNAFEMASFLWSLWEIREPSCFMDNRTLVVIRLSFGVISQIWCSFITFPLYVIVSQMGSRFKKSVISENVRKSLSKWQRRAKGRQSPSASLLGETPTTSVTTLSDMVNSSFNAISSGEGSSSGMKDSGFSHDLDNDYSCSHGSEALATHQYYHEHLRHYDSSPSLT